MAEMTFPTFSDLLFFKFTHEFFFIFEKKKLLDDLKKKVSEDDGILRFNCFFCLKYFHPYIFFFEIEKKKSMEKFCSFFVMLVLKGRVAFFGSLGSKRLKIDP